MPDSKEIVPFSQSLAIEQYDDKMLSVIQATVAKGTTQDELALFLEFCQATELNPFKKEVYCIVREGRNRSVAYQIGIDGFRKMGHANNDIILMDGPFWCGLDGKWMDLWLDEDDPPFAAKFGIQRKGMLEPVWGIARYSSYVQTVTDKNGNKKPTRFWATSPDNQLAKCAEAQAWRKLSTGAIGQAYIREEMQGEVGEWEDESGNRVTTGRLTERLAPGEAEADGNVVDGDVVESAPAPDTATLPAPAPVNPKPKKARAKRRTQAELKAEADKIEAAKDQSAEADVEQEEAPDLGEDFQAAPQEPEPDKPQQAQTIEVFGPRQLTAAEVWEQTKREVGNNIKQVVPFLRDNGINGMTSVMEGVIMYARANMEDDAPVAIAAKVVEWRVAHGMTPMEGVGEEALPDE